MKIIMLARVAVETVSPLAVCSGDRDLLSSDSLARDWNDLPYLPATSLTGVWRSVIEGMQTLNASDPDNRSLKVQPGEWFGYADDRQGKSMASRIILSDGLLLDSNSRLPGQSRDGLLLPLDHAVGDDPVYRLVSKAAENDYVRPHCRLNARRVCHDGALYHSKVLPTGLRFAFDVRFELKTLEEQETCLRFLEFFRSGYFSLGSKTANGQGRLKVIGQKVEIFDLEAWKDRPGEMARKMREFLLERQVAVDPPADVAFAPSRSWNIRLSSQGTMRVGTGSSSRKNFRGASQEREFGFMKGEASDENNVQHCYSETRLRWNGSKYQDQIAQIVIPGSTIKGILAHRTMYHFLRNAKMFAGTGDENHRDPAAMLRALLNNETPPAELEPYYRLFGVNDPGDQKLSRSGALMVSDAVVECRSMITRMHNRIDRFTGGVMPSGLFGQVRLVDPSFTVNIRLRPQRFHDLKDAAIMKSFEDTIYDLKNGFLNICAGSGRDTAVFTGTDCQEDSHD